MKYDDIGSENKIKWQHFKASSGGVLNGSNGSPSNDLNEADLCGDAAGLRDFIGSRAAPTNKFLNSMIPSNAAWSPCKKRVLHQLVRPFGHLPSISAVEG
jgi:hypothetical protein